MTPSVTASRDTSPKWGYGGAAKKKNARRVADISYCRRQYIISPSGDTVSASGAPFSFFDNLSFVSCFFPSRVL